MSVNGGRDAKLLLKKVAGIKGKRRFMLLKRERKEGVFKTFSVKFFVKSQEVGRIFMLQCKKKYGLLSRGALRCVDYSCF